MEKIKFYLGDIRFWIIFFFLIRLYGITLAPLEVAHNWRQTTVTMAARNFHEVDANIFYPRIDFAGEKTGITGMEFPVLNYTIHLVSIPFGYQHWYGRLINLFITSIGIFYFFKLARKYSDEKLAFNATLILLCSIWFAYSRKIMPDTFSMSLVFIASYYGSQFLDRKTSMWHLPLYAILVLLGILAKLPSGFILILFVPLILNKSVPLNRKIAFILINILILIPVGIYYFYWIPYLVETYGFWHFFMGKSISEGFKEISLNLVDSLAHFYDYALKFIGFAFFCIGIFRAIIQKNNILLLLFALALVSFSVIVFKAGYTFTHHAYYIIPFVPIMSFIAAYGLCWIPNKNIMYFLLALIMIEGIGNWQHDFRISTENKALLLLEKDLDLHSKRSDLIAVNSGEYPTPMYFSHRKGWINSNEELSNVNYVNQLKLKGLKYILILKKTFGTDVILPYKLLLNKQDYSLYAVK